MLHLFHPLKKWRHQGFIERIEHFSVVQAVVEEGQLTARYAFMTILSAAIAVLGLLLSSPAVVIGAMLLSPLMGPIMALGFALCILDLGLLKQSLISLAAGVAIALAVTFGIVYASPIVDATAEILARTQPNLFDLLVAIFSGLAGGYVTIKRNGEGIVGVAIATALMPPLAVVGYGLATDQWNITRGATLLFMTNLLAIALSVTALAKWSGFGSRHSPTHTIWQTLLILGVFGALSLPLGVALKDIAHKGYVTKTLQTVLNEQAAANRYHVAQFNITFPKDEPVEVHATLLTRRYIADADQTLEVAMTKQIGRPVALEVDQLIVARAEEVKSETPPQIAVANNPLAAPAASTASAPTAGTSAPTQVSAPYTIIVAYAKESLALPVKGQRVDENARTLTLIIEGAPLPEKAKQKIEKELTDHFPAWEINLRSEVEEKRNPGNGGTKPLD